MDRVIQALPYIVVVLAFLIVRVLAMLMKHQQKMTQILHRSSVDHEEVDSLRRRIGELEARLGQQNLGGAQTGQDSTPQTSNIAERLTS